MDYESTLNIIQQCIVTDLGCTSYKREKDSIVFTCNNLSYVCVYASNETNYLRLVVPNIDTLDHITSVDSFEEILRLNAKYKNVKFILVEKSLWASSEIFLTGQNMLKEAFVVMVRLLEVIRKEYANYVTKNIEKNE